MISKKWPGVLHIHFTYIFRNLEILQFLLATIHNLHRDIYSYVCVSSCHMVKQNSVHRVKPPTNFLAFSFPIFRPYGNKCCRLRSNQSTKKVLKIPCGDRAQTDNIVSVVRAVGLQIGRNWQCRKFCVWRELPPIFKQKTTVIQAVNVP